MRVEPSLAFDVRATAGATHSGLFSMQHVHRLDHRLAYHTNQIASRTLQEDSTQIHAHVCEQCEGGVCCVLYL
jgi:hypothetical protein